MALPAAVASMKKLPGNVRQEPAVIVDGRQRAALAMLFRMVDQGRVDGDSFAGTVAVSLEPIAAQVEAITVPPVVVNGIAPGGVLPNDNEH